ncbi:lycopene cyclase domain-containing protein [Microbacterium sp.]|uniref:lycopene cyclase domain-containing protein n=1 Tax=Microbacterium sp. TaxID=51671 RepID=UPI003A9362CF
MTYLLLSLPFVGASLVVFIVGAVQARRRGDLGRYFSAWAVATLVLLVLTAVFDNIMIAAGFFDYREDGISGIRLGLMPIEDFLYPLAGALLLSGVWQLLGATPEKRRSR